MCGISGIVNFNGSKINPGDLDAMIDAMRHRGPDDEGIYRDDQVGLGFVRLSIIDLSYAGHQPMYSQDKRFIIIFNGEIYNYIELRNTLIIKGHQFKTKTDTEVLLTAYIEWGENMLHRLNGMWAFVIYDRKEKMVFGARDRYGIKPFYYSLNDKQFIFSSEIPSILKVIKQKPNADEGALFEFLIFNRTDQTENTFFKEVKKLEHGHFIKIGIQKNGNIRDKIKIKKWYDLRKEIKPSFKNPEEFREMLSSSLGLRLRSDVPVGVCLSGGLDSSSIVSGLLKDFNKDDLNTFSAVYRDGAKCDESAFIDEYREDLKNMYFITPDANSLMQDISRFVKAHGEPIASTSPYAQFKVMELAKDYVTVTLDGQGADEELAGYHYFFGFYFKSLLKQIKIGRLTSEMAHYYLKHRSLFGIKSFLFFLLPAQLRTKLRANEKGYVNEDFYQSQHGSNGTISKELYGSPSLQEALINHFEYKLEHLLKWEDRNSMWFSMEARVPFLDHRLVERTLSLKEEQIINRGETKAILRKAMKGILPEKIRTRNDKIGFGTPQDEWFRQPMFQKYITDLIHTPSFRNRGFLDIDKIDEIYKKHLARKGNYGNEIWKWIHLENWYNTFID